MMITTLTQALKEITERLTKAGIDGASTEADYFLTHLLGCKRHELYLDAQRQLDARQISSIEDFIRRRLAREPVQYITGYSEFHGHEFLVTSDVLIPRPETELLVDEAVKAANANAIIIDLCTGSGCIAVSIALAAPEITLYALDSSDAALNIARQNAERLGVTGRIRFLQGDLLTALNGPLSAVKADIIVSNPPYVTQADYDALEPEVRLFEPHDALVAGPDGLDFYRRIIKDAPQYLAKGGWLMMEAGYDQATKIKGLFTADGRYNGFETLKDLAGIERVVKTQLKA